MQWNWKGLTMREGNLVLNSKLGQGDEPSKTVLFLSYKSQASKRTDGLPDQRRWVGNQR